MSPTPPTPPAAIKAAMVLRDLVADRDRIDDQIHRQVLNVIDAGGSWSTIGFAAGISKQAAWERYRRVTPEFAYVHPLDKPSTTAAAQDHQRVTGPNA